MKGPKVEEAVKAEMAYILSDPAEPSSRKIPWANSSDIRRPGRSSIGKFLTDPVWWFYLYWLALFLNNNFGLSTHGLGAAR